MSAQRSPARSPRASPTPAGADLSTAPSRIVGGVNRRTGPAGNDLTTPTPAYKPADLSTPHIIGPGAAQLPLPAARHPQPTPTPEPTDAPHSCTNHDPSVLRALSARMRDLGFVGPVSYLRKYFHDAQINHCIAALVTDAINQVRDAIDHDPESVRNTGGLLRWLIDQELRAVARYQVHREAGTAPELRPPMHADWRSLPRPRREA